MDDELQHQTGDEEKQDTLPTDEQLTEEEVALLSARCLFESLDVESSGECALALFDRTLRDSGIFISKDIRLQEVHKKMQAYERKERTHISFEEFLELTSTANGIITKTLQNDLVIPDWKDFTNDLQEIYNECKELKGGKNADYIPELARQDPNWFGVTFCSVDGQMHEIGDTQRQYSVQSSSKPISYLIAMEELGQDVYHRFVGREPSGRSFNELCLNDENIPHNPMVNSGAIMTASTIKYREPPAKRFRHIMATWKRLAGDEGTGVGFSNTTYLSERETADRNFCLGYLMQEHEAFEYGNDHTKEARRWDQESLTKNLELYFMCCSILVNCSVHAVVAATLANGGVCPVTGERVFKQKNVRHCLSLMLSCGMYDYSGEWAYTVGMPAKSGVSGVIIAVIPNVGGLCVWSPPLDDVGNSFKGIEFAKRLVRKFNFHYYDMVNGIVSDSDNNKNHKKKKNPRVHADDIKRNQTVMLCYLCARGDLMGIKSLIANGASVDCHDYDGRTPLHLAASEGQYEVCKFLVAKGAQLEPVDRWKGTPRTDAVREGHKQVAEYLERRILANKMGRRFSVSDVSTLNRWTNFTGPQTIHEDEG